MNDGSVSTLNGAVESSVVIAAARQAVAGSAVCAQAGAANSWLHRARARVIVGLGGEWSDEREKQSTAHVVALADGSRLVAGLADLGGAPLVAWRGSGLRRALGPVLKSDLPDRVRLAGWVIVASVLTNIALLGMLGVHVDTVGWAVRAGLFLVGSAITWRPRAAAAAWQERAAKRRRRSVRNQTSATGC